MRAGTGIAEDHLALSSVLYGFWVANYIASNGGAMRRTLVRGRGPSHGRRNRDDSSHMKSRSFTTTAGSRMSLKPVCLNAAETREQQARYPMATATTTTATDVGRQSPGTH